MTVGISTAEQYFREFAAAKSFKDIIHYFRELCKALDVDADNHDEVRSGLRGHPHLNVTEIQRLWTLLEKRGSQPPYKKGQVCRHQKVLIIGAGPCGLRMAIEVALLGGQAVVVEMRDYMMRNNVLHLWPFVITDLKSIGAKIFYPKFCTGSLDHISIRKCQCVLLKIALLLGVRVFAPVKYEGLVEPCQEPDGREAGWKARFTPEGHQLHQFEFDAIIGADGKRNTLQGFERKVFRGKPAIAITANFVNLKTRADNQAEEVGGLFYIFNQPFFDGMREATGVALENFVYYKDDTHYFVMTAKKPSLLQRGVLKQDAKDTASLLAPSNVDHANLLEYAIDAAQYSTEGRLPELNFARNHRDCEDVAIFDFTAMQQANFSCRAMERRGKRLLCALVGDSLLEPFWPTGSGCARGFLSVYDAAWMLRNWSLGEMSHLEVLAERESVYSLLSQTKPDNLNGKISLYSIDPITRYGTRLRKDSVKPSQIAYLYDLGDGTTPSAPMIPVLPTKKPIRKRSRATSVDTTALLEWFKARLRPFKDTVLVTNLNTSWANGLALCALIQVYRPTLIDVRTLEKGQRMKNAKLAFDLITEEFGIMPTLSPADLCRPGGPDRLAMLSYLSQLHSTLSSMQVATPLSSSSGKDEDGPLPKRRSSAVGLLHKLTNIEGGLLAPSHGRIRSRPVSPRPDAMESISEATEPPLMTTGENAGLIARQLNLLMEGHEVEESDDDEEEDDDDDDYVLHPAITVTRKSQSEKPKEHLTDAEADDVMAMLESFTSHIEEISVVEDDDDDETGAESAINQAFIEDSDASINQEYSSGEKPEITDTTLFHHKPSNGHVTPESISPANPEFRPLKPLRSFSKDSAQTTTQTSDAVLRMKPSPTASNVSDDFKNMTKEQAKRKKSMMKCAGIVSNRLSNYGETTRKSTEGDAGDIKIRDSCMTPGMVKNRLSGFLDKLQEKENNTVSQPQSKDMGDDSIPESEICCICKKTMFVVERHSAHGQFFHKHCFRCVTCKCPLHMGTSALHKESDGSVRFLCYRHALSADAVDDEGSVLGSPTTSVTPSTPMSGSRRPSVLALTPSGAPKRHGNHVDAPHGGIRRRSQLINTRRLSSLNKLKLDHDKSQLEISSSRAALRPPSSTPPKITKTLTKTKTEEEDAIEWLMLSDSEDTPKNEDMSKSSGGDMQATTEDDVSSTDDEEQEEDTSDDEEGEDDEVSELFPVGLPANHMSRRASRSVQLLLAHEIQRELEAVEEQEDELEERGLQVERSLRDQSSTTGATCDGQNALMDQWLEVIQEKNELEEKQSKLMLQVKLLDLEERQAQIEEELMEMEDAGFLATDDEYNEVGEELDQVLLQIDQLKMFLNESAPEPDSQSLDELNSRSSRVRIKSTNSDSEDENHNVHSESDSEDENHNVHSGYVFKLDDEWMEPVYI